MKRIQLMIFFCLNLIIVSQIYLVADERRERIFTNLYETGAWGTNEEGLGSSGPESTIENSLPYIKFVENFIQMNAITSVVDAGCGDWSFSRAVNWGQVNYVGVDIVKQVIERNQTAFSSPKVSFIHADINEADLPAADLLICKDVLQYLSNEEVHQFLSRIDKFKYCLITNDACPNGDNKTRSIVCGDHRPLDLSRPPFYVKGAKIFNYSAGGSEKQVFLKVNTGGFEDAPLRKKCFVINDIHPYQGFFSVFLTVINYLDLYDTQDIDGLIVDFKNHGLFYEPAYGFNSWGYYFEPIELGTTEEADIDYSSPYETGRVSYLAEIGMSRERIAELAKKYIRVKPEILREIDQFVAEKFDDKFVIGTHYRGTDKPGEAKGISYEEVTSAIYAYVNDNQIKDYLIFVATDEQAFLNYMQHTFEGKIIFQECLRSSDNMPIHYFNPNNVSPYKTGKEALVDCLLLSKCRHLIRTSSCLSLASTYFNPNLTEIVLNKRTTHCYRRF